MIMAVKADNKLFLFYVKYGPSSVNLFKLQLVLTSKLLRKYFKKNLFFHFILQKFTLVVFLKANTLQRILRSSINKTGTISGELKGLKSLMYVINEVM